MGYGRERMPHQTSRVRRYTLIRVPSAVNPMVPLSDVSLQRNKWRRVPMQENLPALQDSGDFRLLRSTYPVSASTCTVPISTSCPSWSFAHSVRNQMGAVESLG